MEATGRCLRAIGALILFLMSNPARAQDAHPPDRAFVLGLTGATMLGHRPSGDMLGVGGLVGLDLRLSDGITVRALTSLLRGVDTGDNVGICAPDPRGGCLPRPLSPHWLSTFEANAVVTPFPRLPLSLLAGGGWSFASDAREN